MTKLEKLKEIKDLRKIWPHEALDFTPWISQDENISLLSDTVGIDITVEEKESHVGNFNVDILATETGTGKKIIIENQLEDTNHDHLGKLITYASGKSADIIIWIVKRAREEHRSAIEWLNNHTDETISFFLLEIKLYQIGNSDPAVKFEIIEKPNDWSKEIKKQENSSPILQSRYEYWNELNDVLFSTNDFAKVFRKRKPSTDHWMNFSIGSSECHLAVSQIRKRNAITIELYINQDKELYHEIHEHKQEIEDELGFKLNWLELPDKKASRILIEKAANLNKESGDWPHQFEWIKTTLLSMYKAFKPYI